MNFHPHELPFQLYSVLGAEALTARPRFSDHSRATFDAAIASAERIAMERFATHYRKSDLNEPRLENGSVRLIPEIGEAVRAFSKAGFMAAAFDYELGGMQLPWVITQACYIHFHAANVATFAYCFLTTAAANLLSIYGSQQQKDRYLTDMLSGKFLGTMCLSESQAGSSLADITTKAKPIGNGLYRIVGDKMWISAGEHDIADNIVHLVLAKIEGAPAGVGGISLFIVPRARATDRGIEHNNISLVGLNHKMGYRGTTNTALRFGEFGDCIGELVGQPHYGLKYMFHMMNEARITVGLSAVGVASSAYRVSLDYALSRRQGRHADAKDPSLPQVPIAEHPDVRRLLLEQKAYVEGALALGLYCAWLVDEAKTAADDARRQNADILLGILTPIMKAWATQWCLHANDHAIQVLGGAGYTRDFPVEQLYRDNRLNPIHEGTNGIQAIDLLGRKVAANNGEAVQLLQSAMAADAEIALRHDRTREFGAALHEAITTIGRTTESMLSLRRASGQGRYLANASAYLEIVGRVVVAWMWLRQANAANTHLGDIDTPAAGFYAGKLHAARYFFRWKLPEIGHLAKLASENDDTFVAMNEAWL